jgi:hypothetical protein
MTTHLNHLQKKQTKSLTAKQASSKAEKNHQSTAEKTTQPPKHNRKTAKAPKKPPSHQSIIEKTASAQSSNVVQPPKHKKPPMINKTVEPISKRNLAWETTEEGKTTITDVLMSKQTYVASDFTADERALANFPTQKLVQVIDFVEQSGTPISVVLGHEEPHRDPNFQSEWNDIRPCALRHNATHLPA